MKQRKYFKRCKLLKILIMTIAAMVIYHGLWAVNKLHARPDLAQAESSPAALAQTTEVIKAC